MSLPEGDIRNSRPVALSVPELNSFCMKQLKPWMGRGSIPNQIQIAALALTNILLGVYCEQMWHQHGSHTGFHFECFKNTAVC